MEKQYTVQLTERQIDVLRLGLTVLAQHNRETIGMLAGDPEYRDTVARCMAEMDTGDAVFTLLCRAICGD